MSGWKLDIIGIEGKQPLVERHGCGVCGEVELKGVGMGIDRI
jgi:hypothetical protein